jgi:hypothetical protein
MKRTKGSRWGKCVWEVISPFTGSTRGVTVLVTLITTSKYSVLKDSDLRSLVGSGIHLKWIRAGRPGDLGSVLFMVVNQKIYRERETTEIDDRRLTGYQVGLLASSSSQSQIGRCHGLWLLTWNLLRLLLIHACRRPIEAAAPTSSPPDSNLRPLVPMSSHPQSRLSIQRWRYGSMAAYRDGELNCSQRKTVRVWRCAPLRQGSCRPIRAVLDSIW